MLINLSKILSVPSYKDDFSVPFESETIEFMGSSYRVTGQPACELRVENIGKNQAAFSRTGGYYACTLMRPLSGRSSMDMPDPFR